jgi:hypothetical protein
MSQTLVLAFLNAMEDRNLAAAEAMLAPGFTMTFPGGNRFTTLPALVAWSAGRYRSVRKSYTRIDELRDGETIIVYCYGTLNGEDLAGQPIANVRFIDRFEARNGRLTDQQVWNDLHAPPDKAS